MTKRHSINDDNFLRQIARMSYEEGLTHEEIAKKLGYTRPAITRALQRARDKGIVQIRVVPEIREGYIEELKWKVRYQLGLEDVHLVAGNELEEPDDPELEEPNDPIVAADIASAAARYLDNLLPVSGEILAVSGGRQMIRKVVQHLRPARPLPNLEVVPTMGFIRAHANFGDPNLIAYDIAAAYAAKHSWLPIPAITESSEHNRVARELPIAKKVLQKVENADIFILGIWAPYSKELLKRGILNDEQIAEIKQHDPVVNINLWFYDKNGACINEKLSPAPYHLTGFEIPNLKRKIEEQNIKVILVAGGSKRMAVAINAILKAGLANILITDHIIAQQLINELN